MAKKKDKEKQADPRVAIEAEKAEKVAERTKQSADSKHEKAKRDLDNLKRTAEGKLDRALAFLDDMSRRGRIKDGGQGEAFKKKMREQLNQYIDAVAVIPEA